MKQRIYASALFALLVSFGSAHAQSTSPVILPGGCGTGAGTGSLAYLTVDPTLKLCVNATVSASVSGFTPGNTFATLTATGSSASVALPAGTTVAIQNTGTTTVSCTLGIGSATALASEIQVPASSSVFVTPGSNTFGACIDQTGTVSNLVVLAGGSGLGTGFGGGGGGSGGSSAITTWGGATLGAATAWGSAPTGNVNGVNANVLASVLPTGAATSANQATEITSLGTIATNSGTQATAANQAAGNASLATIATNSGLAVPVNVNGTPTAQTGLTPGTAQTGTKVAANTDLSSIGGTAAIPDPCQTATKVYTPVNVVTATNIIITGVAAKKKYVCGIFLYPGGTDNIAIYQATTSTSCVTSPVGVIGGATTATGIIATAQAGFVLGNGASAVAATTVVATDLCITTSAAVQLSGVVVTVDQ